MKYFKENFEILTQACSNQSISRTQITNGTNGLKTVEIRSKMAHVHQKDEQHVEMFVKSSVQIDDCDK